MNDFCILLKHKTVMILRRQKGILVYVIVFSSLYLSCSCSSLAPSISSLVGTASGGRRGIVGDDQIQILVDNLLLELGEVTL